MCLDSKDLEKETKTSKKLIKYFKKGRDTPIPTKLSSNFKAGGACDLMNTVCKDEKRGKP